MRGRGVINSDFVLISHNNHKKKDARITKELQWQNNGEAKARERQNGTAEKRCDLEKHGG
jgi:hypothetical protein